jgi:sec-independent protein translocase protein TatA
MLAMPNIGPMEIVGLLLLALLLFGAKRLPEIGRSLGTGMREFKDSIAKEPKPETTRSELPPPVPAAPEPVKEPEAEVVEEENPATTPTSSASPPERETETVS